MKTQFKRFSKSTISVLLAVCLLFSCMTVGLIATSAAQSQQERLGAVDDSESVGATQRYIYVGLSNDYHTYKDANTWGINFLNGTSPGVKQGTDINATYNDGNRDYHIYRFYVYDDHTQAEFKGNDSWWKSKSSVTLNGTTNNAIFFSASADGWEGCFQGNYQYTSTASLAATKTSMTTAESSTLTPSLSSNATYNAIKSTTYEVTTNPSSGGSVTSAGVFTATKAGTYTVTATVTYNAKSFTGITKTATATKQITVTQAATNYTGITAVAKGTTDGTNYSVSLGTIQSSTTVSSSTGLAVNAGTQSGYTFYKWVASGSGTFDNANSASTTFHPAANSEVATAQFKKSYSITSNTPSNGTITLSKTTAVAGETFKVTLAPSSGYRVATFTVDSVDKKSSLNSSNEYTHTCTGTGDSIAVSATFEAIPATTIYIKKTLNTTDGYTNIHLWDGSSTTNISDAGSWPGDAFTTSPWTTTSDGKYYYRTYTWNVSTFKFILNNGGDSKKTTDSDAYDTGKTYYINTATAGQKASLTEGTPTAKAITYTSTYSSASDVTWGGTKPATAYPGEEVSFTVSAKTGYKLTSVTYTPTGGSAQTITATSGTYKFTMPAGAVTVTANTVKQYTVTLTAGTGFATKKYKVGSGTQQTYSSAITVDSGSTVVFDVTYTTGYEYDSANSTLNGAVASNSNKTFTLSNVSADTTVILAAKKITWTGLTAVAKYSTDGNTYGTSLTTDPAVSIDSTSATQLDGTNVTAPDETTVGGVKYKFAQWYTANGSITGDTTSSGIHTAKFKPSAASAIAVAQYKKVYTITSSVNTTNATGVGTVSTSVSEVVAGGSYTISATVANTYHAIESVTVNGTAKTATASQTISGVTANQTVVAKFKSRVQIKGTSPINATAWAGEDMTTNAAGTSFSITKTLDVGTHQFRLYAKDAWVANSVTTWDLNDLATHGTSGNNLTITPTVKVNVTFVSDGTKFTSITAVPYDSTKYTVTLKKVAGSTITGSYMGTDFTTASADATVQVYSGTAINFTVTAASDKYLTGITTSSGTLDPVFNATTHAATYTGAVTVTAATTITPAVADKLKVTTMSNKTAWGTVSASPEYARPGDPITITCTPAAGTLSTLVAYDTTNEVVVKSWKRNSSGQMVVENQVQNSANQFTQVGLSGIAGSIYSFIKDAGEALGAADDSKAVGDDPFTFNMPNGKVSITATYEEYVGTSEYYYNYYSNSGKGNSTQMSEGRIDGNAYGYYNVTDRTGNDQPFTVSHRTEVTGTRYVYFTCPGSWNNLHVYFFDGVSMDWPGNTMEVYGAANNHNYRYAIPSGAKKVIFNNGNNSYQTVNIDLTNTNGAYYVSSNEQTKSASVGQWDNPPGDAGIGGFTETEYFSDQSDNDIYPASYQGYPNAGLFNDHGISGDKRVAKPKGDDFGDNKTDYYILVFYPGVTYTINGNTFTPQGNPLVHWSTTLPGQTPEENPAVKVYAKDGTIRRDDNHYTGGHNENDRDYSTFEKHANTFVYSDSGYANHIGTRSSNDGKTNEGTGYDGFTYDYVAKFTKGETLYIKTNIDDTLKATHYLAAYCINGKTYKLHTEAESATGSVTEAFTVPEDWEDKYVEITPIYFLKTTTNNIITFYVEGYDQTVMDAGWGNTPSVYPFYQDEDNNYVSNVKNAFGGYPGQPMVFYQGNYYIQLPKTIQATIGTGSEPKPCTIKGVTLGNGYWDDIHYLTGEVSAHLQTYDYDDLYKIVTEYPNDANHVICSFKYRKAYNNGEPGRFTRNQDEATYKNGWEVLTDYYGRPVDVFGNLVYGANGTIPANVQAAIDAKTPADKTAASVALANTVHVISQDYKSNSAGDYGTEWAIYNTSGEKVVKTGNNAKTTIVPSALAIKNSDDFDNYDAQTRAFQGIYDVLDADANVKNQLTIITYEQSIAGGGNYADRCDARWYFSKSGEPISAKTMIEYTNDDGKTWQTDTYQSGTGTGTTTGAKAYFLGRSAKDAADPDTATDTTGVSGENTTTLSGTTGGGYYVFDAEEGSQYEFVGWYLLRDNYQNISVRSSYAMSATEFKSHAEQAKNGDIFVARFKKTANGSFDIHHEVHPQTSGYGSVYVTAVVKDSQGTIRNRYETANQSTVSIPAGTHDISSGNGYTIEATFTAVPYATSDFDKFYATIQEELEGYEETCDYIDSITFDSNAHTATVIYNVDKFFSYASGNPVQTISSVTHYSKFNLKTNIPYSLEYKFKTRYYGDKLYKKSGTYTESELRSYYYDVITSPTATLKLTKQFVQAKAPFESNYREDLTWIIDEVELTSDTSGKLTAHQTPKEWAKAVVYDFRDDGTTFTKRMAAPYDLLFKSAVEERPDSDEDAEEMKDDWGEPTFDELYAPGRWNYTEGGVTSRLYIDHWDIYQLDSFTIKKADGGGYALKDGINFDVDMGKSVLVAQTYSARFNYVGYEDYAIVPVYSKNYVDRQAESDGRTDASATLVSVTRNHWNDTVNGEIDNKDNYNNPNTDYDRVYIDFMLNYNYSKTVDGKTTNVQLRTTDSNVVVGFVVRSYTVDGNTRNYRSRTQTVVVNKANIDDKNRLEYCYGFTNNANNAASGLYYEFTPFIIDKTKQGEGQSSGVNVTLPNNGGTFKALYAIAPGKELAGVNFYMIGKSDTSWGSNT